MDENIQKPLGELISVFDLNIDRYKKGTYDESNTRVDFIDKLFELLGWDVRNTSGYSEDYRDVVREDKVTIAGNPNPKQFTYTSARPMSWFPLF